MEGGAPAMEGAVPAMEGAAPAMEGDGEDRVEFFSFEIKVEGFCTTDSLGRKIYSKGTLIKWNVEIGSFTFELMMNSLKNEVKWAANQSATVWYFDKKIGEDVRLRDEIQMLDLFEMYKSEMSCQVIVSVFDKDVCANHEFDSLVPLCVVPPVEPNLDEPIPAPFTTTSFDPNVNQATNPPVSESTNPPVEEPEPDREPDMFDNEEEYVGVDDEHFYVPVPPTHPSDSAPPTQPSDSPQTSNQPTDPFTANGGIPLEAEVNDADPQEIHVIHDPENPNIAIGAQFPDIIAFRKAIRHHAVKVGFEFAGLKTDKTRFIAHCAAAGCPWRIHASRIYDKKTIEIKVLPTDHNCATTKLRVGKMASQGWCADRLGDWLKKNPRKRPCEAKEKLEEDYGIQLKYSKAYSGMKLALNQIHGTYEESFQLLFNWKAQIEVCSPGSVFEIELERGKKKRFKRMFVALKPCIDGFLAGCRPFLGVDATALNGKYTGQLASATGVDGHNWLYYVAYAIFDAETDDNWTWFMEHLRRAVGSPSGLVICTDACKGLENAVGAVFLEAEYRECMRHMYGNFMKYYTGDVFTDHLYPAARSYTEGLFKWHMQKINEVAPDAIQYLQEYHNRIWYRCGFSEASKCDYLTNNVSESFNSQIKKFKGLLPHKLVDSVREMIMEKRYLRRMVGTTMNDGEILPNVIKDLNTISKNLRVVKVSVSDPAFAKVTLLDPWNNTKRHTVDLVNQKCSCREWQVTGKPCRHALAWILSNRGLEIPAYVHEYYSVDRLRAAYAGRVEAMPDKSQWPVVDLGFKVLPPVMKKGAGRPKKQRIRGSLDKNATKKKVRCKRCGGFGHFIKTCKLAEQGEDGASRSKNNRNTQEEEAGPSIGGRTQQKKKKPKPAKKKKTAKKKTPMKKKLQKTASAPPPSVVRSLTDWLGL